MADTAFKTMYRDEYIATFEQKQSFLRSTTVTEAMMSGRDAVFLTAGTGGDEAKTRGVDGSIPTNQDDLTQYTATLVEWHDKRRRTNFNIFASQGDGRRIMQENSVKVINRKIDQDILAALSAATTSITGVASVSLIAKAQTILGNNEVDVEDEDNMFAVISPAMRGYLMQATEFSSGDFVEVKPFSGPVRRLWRWMGVNWITHPNVSGVGTAAEICYMYHRDSIGHAVNAGEMDVSAGYNDEDSYYWARCSIFMGSKLLQNSGVIKITHDGSGLSS